MICDQNCFECKFEDCILDSQDISSENEEIEIYLQKTDPLYLERQLQRNKRKAYYEKNKNKIIEYQKEYREKHKTRIKEIKHQYYLNHKKEYAIRSAKRNERIKQLKKEVV